MVPGLTGGFVAFGSRTSKYKKAKMSEFIEYLYSYGAENEVQWSEKSQEIIREALANG